MDIGGLAFYFVVALTAVLLIQVRARRTGGPATKEELRTAVRAEAEKSAANTYLVLGAGFLVGAVVAFLNGAALGAIVLLLCGGLSLFGGMHGRRDGA